MHERPPPDRPLLPADSADEAEEGWGERPPPDRDDRYRDERPPHHEPRD